MTGLARFSLDGKRALVTGASRGLGRAMAIALAESGADVVCASSKLGGAAETIESICTLGRSAWGVHADLANRDELSAMADEAERVAGHIDILVNNGGSIARHPAVEFPEKEWDRIIHTNLDSGFFLSQRVGRSMIERQAGKIINVASLLSFSGAITVPGDTASEHAVAGLTKA